jgi:hypothetical protein
MHSLALTLHMETPMDANNRPPEGTNPANPEQPVRAYEVGYGRPPKAGQFQKGRSGNPAGAKAHKKYKLQTAVDAVLSESLVVTVNGREKKATVLEGLVLHRMKQALAGDISAVRHIVNLAKKTSRFADLKQIMGVYERPEPHGQGDFDILRYRQLKAEGVDLSGDLDLNLFPEVEEDS